MYYFVSFRVTYLFDFRCYGVDAMGRGLNGINYDKRKYDTILKSCEVPPSLEEERKPAVVSSVASDNAVSE